MVPGRRVAQTCTRDGYTRALPQDPPPLNPSGLGHAEPSAFSFFGAEEEGCAAAL